jgi:hypothetical protein
MSTGIIFSTSARRNDTPNASMWTFPAFKCGLPLTLLRSAGGPHNVLAATRRDKDWSRPSEPDDLRDVTSGVNFTQNQRFEFPYDVVSASSPEPVKDATVLGPIKMLWGGSGSIYPSLH